MRQRLPQQQAELGDPVEATPVRQREHQDAHLALQDGQLLPITSNQIKSQTYQSQQSSTMSAYYTGYLQNIT